jgi:DNA ligase-associated metallophosphoesterase
MKSEFQFGGATFRAAGDAALYWPDKNALLVADLHLEKGSSFAARGGQMLPPYDSQESLVRLKHVVREYGAKRVYCLGDNFHDDDGEARISGAAALLLAELTGGTEWHWIVGNHDPGLTATWGGAVHREIETNGIMLRHNIVPTDPRPEISGHYHPKLRFSARGRMISRRCFLQSGHRLILPAFGALTGGMDAAEILRVEKLDGSARALVPVDSALAEFAIEPQTAAAV